MLKHESSNNNKHTSASHLRIKHPKIHHPETIQRRPFEEDEESIQMHTNNDTFQLMDDSDEEDTFQMAGFIDEDPIQMTGYADNTLQMAGNPDNDLQMAGYPDNDLQMAGNPDNDLQMAGNPPMERMKALQKIANNSVPHQPMVQLQKLADETSHKRNNTGLPDNLKSGIENLSGFSMDDVKVHYNSDKPVQLNAHAYAQGTDIHLGPGQEKHLPHEAWHVVQQKQGIVKPTMQMKDGANVNNDTSLEKEADVMGAKAVQMKPKENKSRAVANSVDQKKSNVKQGFGFVDNRPVNIIQRRLQVKLSSGAMNTKQLKFGKQEVMQLAFINATNNPAVYPHLHTAGQYVGYTYSPGHHVQLRSNGGAIANGWFQTIGIAIAGIAPAMSAAYRADHNAILNWINANEPTIWATRR